jgi:hypothetical protein
VGNHVFVSARADPVWMRYQRIEMTWSFFIACTEV